MVHAKIAHHIKETKEMAKHVDPTRAKLDQYY